MLTHARRESALIEEVSPLVSITLQSSLYINARSTSRNSDVVSVMSSNMCSSSASRRCVTSLLVTRSLMSCVKVEPTQFGASVSHVSFIINTSDEAEKARRRKCFINFVLGIIIIMIFPLSYFHFRRTVCRSSETKNHIH